ncbi:GntR family transcriptional regulator [Klugiella xanthotipulae]|uniref:GntR family transcriptional regulator n=1 Tax=Klugiella xanthotipulae TaxID=244735 RepID=A0A543I4L8_9MICO|nr:GntR family transcriptional regulator [Klugiella xanthotipulae]TQM65542.1 GntR family transcriptional regulator [Klugiella xanthotipulae]
MRASDRAYVALRDEIVTWQLAPGTVLAEVEQSTRLGVSRTPLREALSRLVADGLVATQAGRGLVVTEVSVDGITELFEVRQALEQQAARLAAARRDPQIFAALRDEFARVPELLPADDAARHDYFDLVRRLDEATDEATQSPYLVQAISNVRTHLVRIRRLATDKPQRLLAAAREHAAIVDAVLAGDPELAASATHLHLHNSLASVRANAQRALAQAGESGMVLPPVTRSIPVLVGIP